MVDVEKAAGVASVDDFVEIVGFRGVEGEVEWDVFGSEVVGGDRVTASDVFDVVGEGECCWWRRWGRYVCGYVWVLGR